MEAVVQERLYDQLALIIAAATPVDHQDMGPGPTFSVFDVAIG
jgi:hypothetical protein